METIKVEVLLNKSHDEVSHPELTIKDLGVKSLYTEAKGGGAKRLEGRHFIVEGPASIVRSYLDKLSETYDVHTDL